MSGPQIAYRPQAGTEITINERPVMTDKGDQLIQAFIDLWLGQEPVSADLRSARCSSSMLLPSPLPYG